MADGKLDDETATKTNVDYTDPELVEVMSRRATEPCRSLARELIAAKAYISERDTLRDDLTSARAALAASQREIAELRARRDELEGPLNDQMEAERDALLGALNQTSEVRDALAARCGKLESSLKLANERAERLEAALRRLHDESCTIAHGKRLNLGPMVEPSEAAVLQARAALAGLPVGEKEDRCPHDVWASDHCWECNTENKA